MREFSTDEFLTVAEVASTLRLTEQTVRNWIDDGKLPAFRIGRRVRVARSDFDRLVNSAYTRASGTQAVAANGFWEGDPEAVSHAEKP